MSDAASVGSGEYLRLFCALRLPAAAVAGLLAWQDAAFAGTDVRVAAAAHLHVTLAFLGRRPAADVEPVTAALRGAADGIDPPVLAVRSYRETRSVGMLVFADEDGRAAALAADLHERLERLGVYERERRPWLPHVTVMRFRTPPRQRPALPDLGEVSPSEAAVYSSVLRPTGAQYEVLESVRLGG